MPAGPDFRGMPKRKQDNNMKNIIPLITAVLLGLAAIFAVSKTVKHNEKPDERMRNVLIVTGEILPGELRHIENAFEAPAEL